MKIANALRNAAGQCASHGATSAEASLAPGLDAATDEARLEALGIGLTAIEQCDDAELLWRVVRELVLPQRVSEPIQQRILRRVWVVDPDFAKGNPQDLGPTEAEPQTS